MTHLRSSAPSRTLTIVLSESDWRALRAVEPDAVGWLHERIRERLGTTRSSQESTPAGGYPSAPSTHSTFDEDEY